MISAILGIVLAQYPVKVSVLELPDPESETVSIHAYLWRDANYTREEGAWRVICNSIGVNSIVYNSSEVDFFGGSAGLRPKISMSEEFVRFEVVSSPEKWKESLHFAANMIAQPNWRSNQWEEKERILAGAIVDPWIEALWPSASFKEKMQVDEASNAHARILDKMGVRVVVRGPIEIGEARVELEKAAKGWRVPEYRGLSRFAEVARPPMTQRGPVSAFEISGAPIRIGEQGSAAQFLAGVAIGVGKGSLLWSKVREEEGLAYRVEGVFWPTRQGFVPRFLMLRRAEESELALAGDMASALDKGVETLDILDMSRAKATARQILLHPNAFASVYVDSETVLFGQADDDLRWRGLLNGMGLPSVPLARWADMVDEVELAEFTSATKSMLDGASMRVTRGIPGL